jgi:hypothetical protein
MGMRRFRQAVAAVLGAVVVSGFLVTTPSGTAGAAVANAPKPDSLGTDFWLGFMENLGPPELTIFLTGPTATTGTVEVPGLAFSAPFTVTPGAVTSVVVPNGAQMSGNRQVQDRGIHVTAAGEVTAYGLNRVEFTTDAFLGLPVDILSTKYLNLGWGGSQVANEELGVVATADATTVTITKVGESPVIVLLNKGQTYQIQESGLTGASVVSDKPVALFGGHQCANIPDGTAFCDHVVEQIPPTETWGKSFVAMPLKTRTRSDTFRVLASADATQVTIDGVVAATLNTGEAFETQLGVTSGHTIGANKPILVAQYSNGTTWDGVTSDPFMMLIPPFEQFLGDYTVTTPATGFSANFINVVAPTSSVGAVTLDGSAIPAAAFSAIGSSAFSGAQLDVALGAHSLSGPEAFGVFSYGFDSFDSYGYAGGLSLAPIVRATNLDLTPATATKAVGTQHCVNAKVTDQNNAPVAGIRVDFDVTGTHPGSGFGNTDAAGNAGHCYTGVAAGSDSIKAAAGTLSDTATVTWTSTVGKTATRLVADPAVVRILPGLKLYFPKLGATLKTGTGSAVSGKTIYFSIGGSPVCNAKTNAKGFATCGGLVIGVKAVLGLGYRATFKGDATFKPAVDDGPLIVINGTDIL